MGRMMRVAVVGLVGLVGVVALPACSDDSSDASAPDNGDFVLRLDQARPEDAHVAELVRTSGVAKEAVDGLTDKYALPEDITIAFTPTDPEQEGPNFDPETNVITIQYPSLTDDREALHTHGYDTDAD